MPETLILKTQANQVFEALRSNGLQPSEFILTKADSFDVSGLVVSRLVHKRAGYFFQFDFNKANKHICQFSPGEESQIETQFPGNWDYLWQYFSRWIDFLRREIEAPDLWTTISKETELADAANAEPLNELFSAHERIQVQASIQEIKHFLISTQSFTQDRLTYIDARLNYLQEASERLGKKDWITLAIGVLFNIVVGVALAPDAARELFRISAQLLGWLLQRHPLLP